MLKRGRKGRISNELVAASCAAIIAVYAAGTWRTREADRRFGVEGEMRRPARPAPLPATPVATAVAATIAAPVVPVVTEPKPAVKLAEQAKADPAPSSSSTPASAPAPAVPVAALPQATEPASPVVAAVVEEQPAAAPDPDTEAAADMAEAPLSRPRWLDGYYTGWGTSRHGDIQSFVRIENGRIIDAGVASCETRYPCDVIERIIRQPIERQGPEVDRVSRATESADAYYYGLVTALANAEAGTFRSVRP